MYTHEKTRWFRYCPRLCEALWGRSCSRGGSQFLGLQTFLQPHQLWAQGSGAHEFLGGYHELKRGGGNYQSLWNSSSHCSIRCWVQRFDRAVAAQSVGLRIPFWTKKVSEFRREVPAKAKVLGPQHVEKWVLPKAFCDSLPQDIRG